MKLDLKNYISVKKLATLVGRSKERSKTALNHNCIGNTLSNGIEGNKNPDKEIKPLSTKKIIIVHIILFINIILYYFCYNSIILVYFISYKSYVLSQFVLIVFLSTKCNDNE